MPVLDLLVAYTGTPSTPPLGLQLASRSLVVFGAADNVILLEASTLRLVRTLAFKEAFPSANEEITSVAVESQAKLITAAAGRQICLWTPGSKDGDVWRIHSTVVLEEPANCIDVRTNTMCIGTNSGMSVYQLDSSGDLLAWQLSWSARSSTPSAVEISLTASYIAAISPTEKFVRVYSTRFRRLTQQIRHPRQVTRIKWRVPRTKYKDDVCLYTMTSDNVIRIFMPVIDAPSHLQLHASFDQWSFQIDDPEPSSGETDLKTPIFWLDRAAFLSGDVNHHEVHSGPEVEESRRRKLKEFADDDWELFAYITKNGSFVVRALTNLDKRPPTLLRQFTYFRLPQQTLHRSSHLLLIPPPSDPPTSTSPFLPALITTSPLRTHHLSVLPLVDGAPDGLRRITRAPRLFPRETVPIDYFVRSPDGSAVASKRREGGGEIFTRDQRGTFRNRQSWDDRSEAIVLLNAGRGLAVFAANQLVVHLYAQGTHEGSKSLRVEHTPPSTPLLLVIPSPATVSQSHSTATARILSITPSSIATFLLTGLDTACPNLKVHSTSTLPLPAVPTFVLPVDPMAWSHEPSTSHHRDSHSQPKTPTISTAPQTQARDVLVSVSADGTLSFWTPALEYNIKAKATTKEAAKPLTTTSNGASGWTCTGSIRTGRTGIRLARCSSAKKTAIVSLENGLETLSIWDSKESEFASGLEYSYSFMPASGTANDEEWKICDFDWTSSGTGIPPSGTGGQQESSILAVGFSHRFVILCEQRMTYFDQELAWMILGDIDLTRWTPNPIADSIWCAGGTFIVGAGHQVFCFGTPSLAVGYQSMDLIAKSINFGVPEKPTLFERVAQVNGPLPDYHPQMLLQCLLWDKVELVKIIIVRLSKAVRAASEQHDGEIWFSWEPLDVHEYLVASQMISVRKASDYSYLFDSNREEEKDTGDVFNRSLVTSLLEELERRPLPRLSTKENAHLAVLIQTTLQIDEQRRSLDANGLRYLISMRSFFLINESQSAGSAPTSLMASALGGVRQRLRYRDIVWASFSQTQEILLSASTEACGGKMSWKDARALGVFLWLQSTESIKSQAEIIARNQYMAGEGRDPTACSLFYFALGKVRLVYGLWKQAAWHPEQQVMLKFLSNDFENPRWRTAALKNAFALMSKQRFEYAAAFFVLGGSLRDAVSVCVKHLQDFQLAIALARIMEGRDDGPVLKDILMNTVLPIAFQDGNRFLASWCFWTLRRRDLSLRILVTPLEEMARIADVRVAEIGNPHYDDPSLALLFMQLKDKSLQTVKGMTEISGRTEFNFVLQMARVFTRMGCHPLALRLLVHWSFDRVVPNVQPPMMSDLFAAAAVAANSNVTAVARPRSPTASKRSTLGLGHARVPSLVIDMDIPSLPTTRPSSPPPFTTTNTTTATTSVVPKSTPPAIADPEDSEMRAQRTGLGSLMRNAKKDVKIAEFDMNAFF